MANRTDPAARSIHGTNPQNLIEKIVRGRIYASMYWKEHCFGLTAETLVDKAMELKAVGGTFGGNKKPTPFLCLVLKMLQIQPEKDIVIEFITNEDYRYVRCLGAFYLRLVGKPVDIYQYLEPLYNDFRKIRYRLPNGKLQIIHVDEFIERLLTEERVCDVILPRIMKRHHLEDLGLLERRISGLEEEIASDSEEDEAQGEETSTKEKSTTEDNTQNETKKQPIRDGEEGEVSDEEEQQRHKMKKEDEQGRDKKRDQSRSRSRDRDKRSRSRDRNHRDRERDRSRNRDRYRDRGRSRSRSRSRDRYRDRGRSRSRSRDRDRDHRDRNRSRSRDRDRRSRSRSRDRYHRDRNTRDRYHSDSRSQSRSRSRSSSRDNKYKKSRYESSRDHRRSQSRDRDRDENEYNEHKRKREERENEKHERKRTRRESETPRKEDTETSETEGGGLRELSVDEMNALRAQLGLPPLQ